MNSTLTPDALINNLNKNYPEIVGNAIIGYINMYQLQQEFLANVPVSLNVTELSKTPDGEKRLNYYVAHANIYQYGKSYFLKEIVYNFMQMDVFSKYINIASQFMPSQQKSTPGTVEEIEGGQKGGNSIALYLMYASLLIITAVTNVTAVSHSITALNLASVSAVIEKGKLPKAIGFQGDLDPLNMSALFDFTKQYTQNTDFPDDRIIKANISEAFEQETIERVKQGLSTFQRMFITDDNIHQQFITTVKNHTEKINMLTRATHQSLEEMCKSFTETTDPKLPIPLFELLNSKMAPKIEELEKNRKLMLAQKEEELRQKKLAQLPVPTREVSIGEVLYEDIKTVSMGTIESVSSFFVWPKSSSPITSKEVQETLPPPSVNELMAINENIDRAVHDEIIEMKPEVNLVTFLNMADEMIEDIGRDAQEALKLTNLRIYLAAICQIKKPKYIFNETTGELYIKDPARSRAHLMVLTKNVISYFNTVIAGLQYVEDGEVYTDIPNETRKTRMESLRQKSEAILEVLTNYDLGLTKSLVGNAETAEDVTHFFQNMASMWIDLKNSMLDTLSQFPLTDKESRKEIERKKEETNRLLREKLAEHERKNEIYNVEIQEKLDTLDKNRQQNSIIQQEWNILNQWFSIYVEGGLKTGTSVINNLVNATSDIGTNTLNNIDMLADKGFSTIISGAWAIALSGMIFAIPAVFFIALRTGFVSAIFVNAKRRIENTGEQNIASASTEINVPGMAPPQISALTVETNFWSEFEEEYGARATDDMINTLLHLSPPQSPRGGRRYNRKVPNRKTRKHKKKLTKKLKRGKRRYTRHKKGSLTKRR